MSSYKYVSHSGTTPEAAKLDAVGRLVYRSNKLGADQRITNTGGGNTSSKVVEKDPLTARTPLSFGSRVPGATSAPATARTSPPSIRTN
ncbi:hypothetical protein EMGBD4_04950 [Verrucomicrobiota bacterium]|nr:hypothetical protein EMGBD4_04950 [Verrucomicrobiota bacterium]